MAISLASLQRKERQKKPIMVLYGGLGLGKSSLAAGAPGALFMAVEDGVPVGVDHWRIESFNDVIEGSGVLYSDDHDFGTLVIDSLDVLEPLVWAETSKRFKIGSVAEVDYGKGYLAADAVWMELIEALKALRDERNMTVIMIAHEAIVTYKNPDTDPYDRRMIKLHKRAAALVQEHADIVAAMSWRVSTVEKEMGFKKTATRAVGGGRRVLHLEERPAFVAKNRYRMPASIDIPTAKDGEDPCKVAWEAFAQHLPEF